MEIELDEVINGTKKIIDRYFHALKMKTQHISPNIQPVKTYFQNRFMYKTHNLLYTFLKHLALPFSKAYFPFLFLVNCQRHLYFCLNEIRSLKSIFNLKINFFNDNRSIWSSEL